MKFIHTGDWHIGKIVNEFSMIEDQEFVLNQLIDIINEEKPQALVIAGDLYDRSIPPVEAVDLLDKTFSKILLELNTPILAIAGNHDGPERLSFGSRILTEKGLHIAGVFSKDVKVITLEDEYGPVNFYLVPYADPKEIKHTLQEEEIHNHDDAMLKVINNIKNVMLEKNNEKHIMVAHGYVTYMKDSEIVVTADSADKKYGLDTCDSERPLSIGGTDIISGEYFESFNYTALGHLHGPQKVGSDKIRYSGSLLKYSFSEINHKKGVTVVEINEDGQVSVKLKELMPRRDMRIIKGPLQELINPEVYKDTNIEDYVYAILTDEGELIDPISKLRAVYPNIMGLTKESKSDKCESRTSASEGHKNKSKLQLFQEFFSSIEGRSLTENEEIIVKSIIENVDREAK